MDKGLFLVSNASLSLRSVLFNNFLFFSICLLGKIRRDSYTPDKFYMAPTLAVLFFYRQILRDRRGSLGQKLNLFVYQLISELCNRSKRFRLPAAHESVPPPPPTKKKKLFSKESVANLKSVRILSKRQQQIVFFGLLARTDVHHHES